MRILCLVVQRADARPLSAEETDAVNAALQYFRSRGERHTADEEVSLFPRLRAASPQPDVQLDIWNQTIRRPQSRINRSRTSTCNGLRPVS